MARKPRKFIPPTLDEIERYVKDEGLHFCPKDFIKHYEAADPPWTYYDRNGKQKPVRNWKHKALNVWEKIAIKSGHIHKCYCGRPGVYVAGYDDTGQAYFRCIDHKPQTKPIITKEQADRVFKPVLQADNRSLSDKRNEQLDKLKG